MVFHGIFNFCYEGVLDSSFIKLEEAAFMPLLKKLVN